RATWTAETSVKDLRPRQVVPRTLEAMQRSVLPNQRKPIRVRPAWGGLLRATFFLGGAALMLILQLSHADERVIDTKQGSIKVETVTDGLDHPWGMAFLPDGRMLVTERPGRVRIVTKDGSKSEPLKGVPAVFAQGQGGLLDVALDPHFANTGLVYLSYSEPGEDGAGTAVARGKLGDGGIDNVEVIFRQHPKISGGNHFGSRLVFAPDGKLFVTLGERFTFETGQDLGNHLWKIWP